MVSREELADHRVSRETWIGAGATALAVAAMAVDHLWDEDGGFSADPAAFFLSCGLSLALGFYVFGRLVPRGRADGRRAATLGFVCSALGALGLFATLWLGLPFVLGGAGIALGVIGRRGERARLTAAAIAVGALVVLLGAGGYAAVAIDKLR
jgi:hypothetical protein